MYKIKNKTYQPIPLIINGVTIIVPGRRVIDIEEVTSQMVALKSQGLLQVIQK